MSDYEEEAQAVWLELEKALLQVGHMWTYDSRTKEIWCKDCEWALDGPWAESNPFMEAVTAARHHRNFVKRAILTAYIESLS